MAKCIQCGSNIKDDATYCPICGLRNPLEKKQNDDFTMTINDLPKDIEDDKSIDKMMIVLAFLLGFTGIQYKNTNKSKMGLIILILSIIFIALGIVLPLVVFKLSLLYSILIGLGVLVIINVICGLLVIIRGKEIEVNK